MLKTLCVHLHHEECVKNSWLNGFCFLTALTSDSLKLACSFLATWGFCLLHLLHSWVCCTPVLELLPSNQLHPAQASLPSQWILQSICVFIKVCVLSGIPTAKIPPPSWPTHPPFPHTPVPHEALQCDSVDKLTPVWESGLGFPQLHT